MQIQRQSPNGEAAISKNLQLVTSEIYNKKNVIKTTIVLANNFYIQ